jgi:hypothetical protein
MLKQNHQEVESTIISVGSTSKLIGAMDTHWKPGPCLYDTKETLSGLWMLCSSEAMLGKER